MNIFVLHFNTRYCAILHCDKHVCKMIIELMQLLCACHCILDGELIRKFNKKGKELKPTYSKPDERMYKPGHINHPCSIWLRESIHNYKWTYDMFEALCDEYTYRYKKVHLTDKKFRGWMAKPPENIPDPGGMTPFNLCMPDEYKQFDKITREPKVVESYRTYYIGDKESFAKWKDRPIPKWFSEGVLEKKKNSC